MMSVATGPRIVLVRPKLPGNIGATARAMANSGLSDLVIVAPQADPFAPDARRMASRAEQILLAARVVERLDEALDGIAFTAAATCRPGMFRAQTRLSARAVGERIVRDGVPAALVFGPEDYGLSNEDLLCCDATARIASHPGYESLNLAQAVMVMVYEWYAAFESATSGGDTPAAPPHARDEAADGALLAQVIERFSAPLARIGYLNPQKPEQLLLALRGILGRAQLSRQDAQILIGLAQQIDRFADGES